MKTKQITLTILAFVAGLGAVPAVAKLNVVATTPDLGSIAAAIGGSQIQLTILAKPTEDPHFVDAKPSFAVKLSRADVLIEGGADLEIGWLPPLVDQAANPRVRYGSPSRVLGNQGVSMLEIPEILDRSKGDIHAAGNPHYLMDPANAKILAARLAETFSQLDAANAATYRANLARFTTALDAKMAEWLKLMEPHRGRHVAAYHNSWVYFAKRFGLVIEDFLEPKPGIPPTPGHLSAVIAKMKAERCRVIICEPYQNRKTAEKVAAETGAIVVDVTQFPGGVKGTEEGYIAMMNHLVVSVAKALDAGR
jgi:zinc/manganese transport system substrate-binding protein